MSKRMKKRYVSELELKELKEMTPWRRLVYWVLERESIRSKKETNQPRPWTNDIILQRFKFCNVRRMDDRVSKWLLTNWYEPYYDHPNMVAAVTLARQLNNTESLADVGFPETWKPDRVKAILNRYPYDIVNK